MKIVLPIVLFAGLLTGCSSTPEQDNADTSSSQATVGKNDPRYTYVPMNVPLSSSPSFTNVYKEWRGTPYKLGGTTQKGIDCSAFVQVGFADVLNMQLPRTTAEQARKGKWVDIKALKKGDLVFFKTGRRLRHVGIYMGNSEFLHASTSQGVMISNLKNPYWQRTYWQARRITP
ncbi:NlpC/P60 family protein [Photobacterium aphoticum]|uniref:NlpC/P60 family protein n=1 Tax=Photobacterium aphoticum TaxID=754436 RepID=UPI000A648F22|nr:NlpC/P60 family protein [Photobacterium aphoticum]GHA39723.1 lipoprotein NlpC [Photobacterium aphoticum]